MNRPNHTDHCDTPRAARRLERIRRHLTPSFVMSTAALFIALGGTGYAISSLPSGSVGATQLKSNAVTAAKIKRGAVSSIKIASNAVTSSTAKDLASNVSVTGATGATGPQGPSGILWADAQTGTAAQPFPADPSCGGMPCGQIATQTFTTTTAGRVFATVNTDFNYTCGDSVDSTTTYNCSMVVTPYIDGVALTGGSKQLKNVEYLTTGNFALSLSGITPSSLAAGEHTLTVWAFVTNDQLLAGFGTSGTTTAEMLVGA